MNIRDVLEQLKRGEIDEERAEQLLKLDFLERIGWQSGLAASPQGTQRSDGK